VQSPIERIPARLYDADAIRIDRETQKSVVIPSERNPLSGEYPLQT
jgi:hypothetical protein